MHSLNARRRDCSGFTLVEAILAAALTAGVMLLAGFIWRQVQTALLIDHTRTSMQLEVTDGMNTITHFLSKSAWNNVVISSSPGLPWSTVHFGIANGNGTLQTYIVMQNAGGTVSIQTPGGSPKIAIHHVVNLIFSYPRTDDPTQLLVTLRAENRTIAGHTISLTRNALVALSAP